MRTENNLWIKTLCFFVTLALIISCVPNQVYALAGESSYQKLQTESEATSVQHGVYEIIARREKKCKTFPYR